MNNWFQMKNRKEEDKNLGEAIQESKQMFKVIFCQFDFKV